MRHLRSVVFSDDGESVVIEYLTPAEDVRKNGLVINHALLVPANDEFLPLIEELEKATQKALGEVLEAHAAAEPFILPPEEQREEASPWDNPLER